MSFDKQQAEAILRDILGRIRDVSSSIQNNIVKYREHDTLVDEADEFKTLRDIRYYLLEDYRKMNDILNKLDKYR